MTSLILVTVSACCAEEADPKNFDDCGLVVPGERGMLCSGDDVVRRTSIRSYSCTLFFPVRGINVDYCVSIDYSYLALWQRHEAAVGKLLQ